MKKHTDSVTGAIEPDEPDPHIADSRFGVAKQDRASRLAEAAEELERLRLMQSDLERERMDLEEVDRRQDTYQRSKREILNKLERALPLLTNQREECVKMEEAIGATLAGYREMIAELMKLTESDWKDDQFSDELEKAFGILEEAESVYARGVARVNAAWPEFPAAKHSTRPSQEGRVRMPDMLLGGFLPWVKVGFAVTLPLVLILIVLCFVLLYLHGYV